MKSLKLVDDKSISWEIEGGEIVPGFGDFSSEELGVAICSTKLWFRRREKVKRRKGGFGGMGFAHLEANGVQGERKALSHW